jgi:hypothetical protein
VQNEVNFSLDKELHDAVIKIYSETGAEMKSVNITSKEFAVPLHDLSAGKYFFKIYVRNITQNSGCFIVE